MLRTNPLNFPPNSLKPIAKRINITKINNIKINIPARLITIAFTTDLKIEDLKVFRSA